MRMSFSFSKSGKGGCNIFSRNNKSVVSQVTFSDRRLNFFDQARTSLAAAAAAADGGHGQVKQKARRSITFTVTDRMLY